MVDNYIEAPEYIIEMLKNEYSMENGDLDLKKLNPETRITAYETHRHENQVWFDTYGGAPASVFGILCEMYPQEEMKYYFYNHDLFGNTMVLLNLNGEAVLDPKYETMLEEQERELLGDDEDDEQKERTWIVNDPDSDDFDDEEEELPFV